MGSLCSLIILVALRDITVSSTTANHCNSLAQLACIQDAGCDWVNSGSNSGGTCGITSSGNNGGQHTPKNMIIMIGDGLGGSYNAVYRKWKDIDETIMDQYFAGIYTAYGQDENVLDSAAAASALATGILPDNGGMSVDNDILPVATILEAAKKAGKLTGVISDMRVAHATPGCFSSHVWSRKWERLVAAQQGARVVGEYAPDIIFGGGQKGFNGKKTKDSIIDITGGKHEDFGWNSYSTTLDELNALDVFDLPAIGLFTDSAFPPYLEREHELYSEKGYETIPGILDMTKKALDLLSGNDDGFVLQIEAGQIDSGGHDNDFVYVLSQMDEYYEVLDYVVHEWMEGRDDTLVVMLGDHETGGLTLGRSSLWDKNAIEEGKSGKQPPNKDPSLGQLEGVFERDPLIEPDGVIEGLEVSKMYDFFIEPAHYATLPSKSVGNLVKSHIKGGGSWEDAFVIIEQYYIETLTFEEKAFIERCYEWNQNTKFCLSKILSVRMNGGWGTVGHTATDISIAAKGVGAQYFLGFNGNIENIGNKLIDILDVRGELEEVTLDLIDLFYDDQLIVCDHSPDAEKGWAWDDANKNIKWLVEGEGVEWPANNEKYDASPNDNYPVEHYCYFKPNK